MKSSLRGLAAADQLDAGVGEHAGLVGAVGDDADVHQLRELVDGVVALVHQRRRRRIGRVHALQPRIELRDRVHRDIGLPDRHADVLLDIGAQGLDALRRRVELLRQRLRRRQHRRLRRIRAGACRQRLHRGGEIAEGVFQRAVLARRAVDVLQLAQDIGDLVGVSAAGGLGAQLRLDILIELAVDAVDAHARAIAGAAGEFDLVDVLGDIARRLRVGDVGRDDTQRGLVGAQAGHRGGEG